MASFSGAFSLHGLFPSIPLALQWIFEPRWVFTLASIILAVAGGGLRRPSTEAMALGAAWSAFALYLVGRSLAARPEIAFADFEPVALITTMLVAAVISIDGAQQALRFLVATAVTIAVVGVGIVMVSALDGTAAPVMPFYASRTFVVGAFVCVFLALTQTRRWQAVLFAAFGVFLVYAGLASIMRASTIMSIAAAIAVLPFLTARGQWRGAAVFCAVICVGLASYACLHGEAFRQKLDDYSPIGSEASRSLLAPLGSLELCAMRIQEVSGHRPAHTDLGRACDKSVVFTDTDGRLRLLLHAWATNPSKVVGAGLGAYEFYEASRPFFAVGHYTYPHNLPAEIFFGGGVIGLGLFGLTLLVVLSICLRSVTMGSLPTPVLLAVVIFTGLVSLVGGDLYDARLLWVFPVVLAAFAARDSSARHEIL